jgi:hypothetical protein
MVLKERHRVRLYQYKPHVPKGCEVKKGQPNSPIRTYWDENNHLRYLGQSYEFVIVMSDPLPNSHKKKPRLKGSKIEDWESPIAFRSDGAKESGEEVNEDDSID